MIVQDYVAPAVPVDHDEASYVGYTAIARRLSALHPERTRPFSRQLVHRWFLRSDYNGFPPPRSVMTKSGKVKPLFNMEAVEQWHHTYRQHRKQKPEIETIPLFQVDSEGKPVC